MKSFDENSCFYPIVLFGFNNSIDIIQYVNAFFVVYYLFLPQAMECKSNLHKHSKYLLRLKCKVAIDIKESQLGI